MCRHLDLMIEVFGEELGCRMFRKVAPWYAKRFGPCHEFNKSVVQVAPRAPNFDDVLENYIRWRRQFLDENGELLPRFRRRRWSPPSCATNRPRPNANRFPCPRAGGSVVKFVDEFSERESSQLAAAAPDLTVLA